MSKRNRIKGPRGGRKPRRAPPSLPAVEKVILLGGDQVEGALADSLRRDIGDEIDDEILFDMNIEEPSVIDRLGALADSKLAARVRAADRIIAKRKALMENMARMSDVIYKRTVRQKNNWVRTSPAIAAQLDPTGEFSRTVDPEELGP